MNANRSPDTTPAVTLPLHAAVELAQRWRGPVRIAADDPEVFAELFLNRGCVIHAEVAGLLGVPAVAAIAGAAELRFRVEPGRWPRRCSMLAPWDSLLREVARLRAAPRAAAVRDDDETTLPMLPG
ncbi:MAG: hypothetical protein K1X88_22985 [Nannocystaceae bacterium]|nr:hypothetical protein [Nannocystaceae bacterium]